MLTMKSSERLPENANRIFPEPQDSENLLRILQGAADASLALKRLERGRLRGIYMRSLGVARSLNI